MLHSVLIHDLHFSLSLQ